MDALQSHLKIRHFSLVIAIADQGTMHKASDVLNMTQSTASKMLGDLEDILGTPLFERTSRGMIPTSIGQYAVSAARQGLARIERFEEELRLRQNGGYGLLSIGAITGAAPDIVAHAVAEMKRQRPQLTIRLLGETSDNILDMLDLGKLDVAVGRFTSSRHRQLFDFELLAQELLVLFARSGHALCDGFDGDLAVLADWPWVMQPPSTPARMTLDETFAKAGVDLPSNVIECVSIFAILNLVQVSDAVAILPASVVSAHLRAGLVVHLPMRPAVSVDGFGIVTRKGEEVSESSRVFRGLLRKYAKSSVDAGPAKDF